MDVERKRRFRPPAIEEVAKEVILKGYSYVDPAAFVNFYGSKGWFVGKNKMKNWRMALAGWEIREKKKHPTLQSAKCIVDRKPAKTHKLNGQGKPVYVCIDCWRALGGQDWGKMSKPEIERAVEEGKRRPSPAKKDLERVTQDKKRAAVAKLTKGLADNLKG